MVKYSKNVVKYGEIKHIVCIFAPTVHTTLPIRTASQGVSFALYTLPFLLIQIIHFYV